MNYVGVGTDLNYFPRRNMVRGTTLLSHVTLVHARSREAARERNRDTGATFHGPDSPTTHQTRLHCPNDLGVANT